MVAYTKVVGVQLEKELSGITRWSALLGVTEATEDKGCKESQSHCVYLYFDVSDLLISLFCN